MSGRITLAWPELLAGFLLGALVTVAFLYAYRRELFRFFANRRLDRTRRLIAEGRTDQAATHLKRLVKESLYADDVPEIAFRQLTEIYKDSGAHETATRIRTMVESIREEHRRVEPGDMRGRVRAILKTIDALPDLAPLPTPRRKRQKGRSPTEAEDES